MDTFSNLWLKVAKVFFQQILGEMVKLLRIKVLLKFTCHPNGSTKLCIDQKLYNYLSHNICSSNHACSKCAFDQSPLWWCFWSTGSWILPWENNSRSWTIILAPPVSYSVHEGKQFLLPLWVHYFLSWFTMEPVQLFISCYYSSPCLSPFIALVIGKRHVPWTRRWWRTAQLRSRTGRPTLARVSACSWDDPPCRRAPCDRSKCPCCWWSGRQA